MILITVHKTAIPLDGTHRCPTSADWAESRDVSFKSNYVRFGILMTDNRIVAGSSYGLGDTNGKLYYININYR